MVGPSRRTRATAGATTMSLRIASRARSMLSASSTCATPNSQTTVARFEPFAERAGADDGNDHQHVDVEHAPPDRRPGTARRVGHAQGNADEEAGKRGAEAAPSMRARRPARSRGRRAARRYSGFACCSRTGDCGAGAALTCVSQEVQQASLTAVLLHVLARVVHEADHVMVVEGVEGLAAGTADTDQPRGSQQPKLVRHGRFAQAHERGQIADATLTVRQRVYNPHAGGIAEELEDIGDGLDRVGRPAGASRTSDSATASPVRLGAESGRWNRGPDSAGTTYEYMSKCSYVKRVTTTPGVVSGIENDSRDVLAD